MQGIITTAGAIALFIVLGVTGCQQRQQPAPSGQTSGSSQPSGPEGSSGAQGGAPSGAQGQP